MDCIRCWLINIESNNIIHFFVKIASGYGTIIRLGTIVIPVDRIFLRFWSWVTQIYNIHVRELVDMNRLIHVSLNFTYITRLQKSKNIAAGVVSTLLNSVQLLTPALHTQIEKLPCMLLACCECKNHAVHGYACKLVVW